MTLRAGLYLAVMPALAACVTLPGSNLTTLGNPGTPPGGGKNWTGASRLKCERTE